ncbi:hypothetical protein E2C01_034539 [Portunus trituberculatus]|uniref:Uncharacterized protein n=1 Tax=Portunus trituberculatus TaxID=210409 RepID=A0A5B7F337_PORTR|nr:hypothetical protein [Portunus trituberculatus]
MIRNLATVFEPVEQMMLKPGRSSDEIPRHRKVSRFRSFGNQIRRGLHPSSSSSSSSSSSFSTSSSFPSNVHPSPLKV